jgi:N-methylhydantoinase A
VRGVLAFPYSAAFSAFGAAAADYEHHYTRAVNVVVSEDFDDDEALAAGDRINSAWEALEDQALGQMAKEGFSRDQVRLRHTALVRYGRQLNDLTVQSPVVRVDGRLALRQLIQAFEDEYVRTYAEGAQYPRAGYEIFEVGLTATTAKVKPMLRTYDRRSRSVSDSQRGVRRAFFDGEWHEATVHDWRRLANGNVVQGPAIVEESTTTLVVPPGRSGRVDEYKTIWLEEAI